jgi:hypothetical protein
LKHSGSYVSAAKAKLLNPIRSPRDIIARCVIDFIF